MKKVVLVLTFIGVVLISGCLEDKMTYEEARAIADGSYCTDEADGGKLLDTYAYNEETKTWWIDLDIKKEGCSPACVVYEEPPKAVINWRCTGLIEE